MRSCRGSSTSSVGFVRWDVQCCQEWDGAQVAAPSWEFASPRARRGALCVGWWPGSLSHATHAPEQDSSGESGALVIQSCEKVWGRLWWHKNLLWSMVIRFYILYISISYIKLCKHVKTYVTQIPTVLLYCGVRKHFLFQPVWFSGLPLCLSCLYECHTVSTMVWFGECIRCRSRMPSSPVLLEGISWTMPQTTFSLATQIDIKIRLANSTQAFSTQFENRTNREPLDQKKSPPNMRQSVQTAVKRWRPPKSERKH